MPDEKPQFTPVPFTPSPFGVVEIYCNFFHVNWSLFDVRIKLAQLVPTQEADLGKPGVVSARVAQERAALTMAWHEAKLLRDALTDAINRYEKVNGELIIPKMAE